jgi:hypothetical protein
MERKNPVLARRGTSAFQMFSLLQGLFQLPFGESPGRGESRADIQL